VTAPGQNKSVWNAAIQAARNIVGKSMATPPKPGPAAKAPVGDGYVIIGPSGAGKTNLLGAVSLASDYFKPQEIGDGITVQEVPFKPLSIAMITLGESFRDIAMIGNTRIAGTQAVTPYDFTCGVEWHDAEAILWKNHKASASFRMLDGPGGALFGGSGAEHIDEAALATFHTQLVEELQRAKGIMLCLDSTKPEDTALLFKFLGGIFDRTALLGPLKCERFVICLTKADALVANHGSRAHSVLNGMSAASAARRLLSESGFNTLRRKLPHPDQTVCGFASIYGFLPNGQVNYDSKAGRLLKSPPNYPVQDAIEAWKPYRIIDPFVFLTTGLRLQLEGLLGA
jgi:hypothetical protein